jgi:hypothetical protein
MKETDKLRILIPHWIAHNQEHANEFQEWAHKASEAAPNILAAADQMAQVNQSLMTALEKLGGALEYDPRQ